MRESEKALLVALGLSEEETAEAELRAARAHVAEVSELLPAVPPSARARARFMLALAEGQPYAGLLGPLAALADMAQAAMRDLLSSLSDAASWRPGPAPGIDIVHIPAGPRLAGAICGFVRLSAGTTFPAHTHLGEETVIIMQGTMHIGTESFSAGAKVVAAEGTRHEVRAGDDEEVIYMVVIPVGIRLDDGDIIDADDPRI